VVAVPAAQGGVAGVGEKKGQRRRFNVAVAKDYVGLALATEWRKKVAHGATVGSIVKRIKPRMGRNKCFARRDFLSLLPELFPL
jgi:hypothetical protein